jgi:general stress protein YciG
MGKEHRGFASMDRDKQREIASKGGRAAHVRGTAHEWTSEQAREAGRKGGLASRLNRHPGESSDIAPAVPVEPSNTENL